KQLVSAVGVRRMDGQLGRWQGEDQPTMPGIYGRVVEHIPEERAIGVGVGAVEHYMRASDHVLTIVGPEHPESAVCRARSACGTTARQQNRPNSCRVHAGGWSAGR